MLLAPHDAGGKTRWPLLPGCRGAAAFSVDNKHRLWLERRWDSVLAPEVKTPFALFIGCNPSTGKANEDDMTIRKNITFTNRLGLCRLLMVNFVTYCVTDPRQLIGREGFDLTSGDNFATIHNLAQEAQEIVIASGDPPEPVKPYAVQVLTHLYYQLGLPMRCLGLTQKGWPRHTSRLPYSSPLRAYSYMPSR